MFWDHALPIMIDKGISQIQLSKEIGKSKSQVNKWVERETIPPADSALKIAQVLGVEIEYFFPEMFPGRVQPSKIRVNFQEWIDSCSDEELEAIVDLFDVLDGIGKRLGR